ncbi:MAG TPA: GDP-mannose 4,6-dehydratase, partial [bacterium]|nr:GDP-mannose 4,6-dehydratase [bacterium]
MEKVLVTGAAGFIGFHLSKRLADTNYKVVGIDNINDYYDVRLKYARLEQLKKCNNFRFEKMDISDKMGLENIFQIEKFDYVVNLAAQAGVRYSLI